MFVPHCVLVPAGVPVHLRITSADVVHSLTFTGTDYGVKVAPGVVSQATLQFSQQAEYPAPCREFCGAGHFAMRSRLRVIPQEQFPILSPAKEGIVLRDSLRRPVQRRLDRRKPCHRLQRRRLSRIAAG